MRCNQRLLSYTHAKRSAADAAPFLKQSAGVNPGSEGPVCNLCPQFNPNALDFQNYLYYVRLTLQTGDQALPVAHALRLLP